MACGSMLAAPINSTAHHDKKDENEDDMDEISISTPTPVRNNTKRSFSEEEKPTMKQESVHFHLFCEKFPSNGISIDSRKSMDYISSKTLRMRSYSVFHTKDDKSTAFERKKQIEKLLDYIHQHSRPSSERDMTDTLSDTSLQSSEEHSKRIRLNRSTLENMNMKQLKRYRKKMFNQIDQVNSQLLRVLKQRQHQENRRNSRYNTITAVLQAMSDKTSADSKLRFSLEPINTIEGHREWLMAMRAIIRLSQGIPDYFRQQLWSVLAENYLNQSSKDWKRAIQTTLCERVMDSDEMIHSQIIKDLHRTGWEEFHDEKKLKQLLLAYARYNKDIGYCQGFNVIGALLLHVFDYSVEEALKVLIYLVEEVLPNGYFDHSLRALSVDMAVAKDLLLQRLPNSMKHLEMLQKTSGNEYEPALMNVFSMHWLLTLYATCLPRTCVYRIWDAVMLEGSEVLLRTSIAIWSKISRKVLVTKTADQFYMAMGKISQSLLNMNEKEQDALIKMMYSMAEFPYPGLYDLREKHTWNIHPLSTSHKILQENISDILSDESDAEDITSCSVCTASSNQTTKNDITHLKKQFKHMQRQHREICIAIERSFYQHTKQSPHKPNIHEIFNHLHLDQNHHQKGKQTQRVSGGSMTVASTTIQPTNIRSKRYQPSNHEDTLLEFSRIKTATITKSLK